MAQRSELKLETQPVVGCETSWTGLFSGPERRSRRARKISTSPGNQKRREIFILASAPVAQQDLRASFWKIKLKQEGCWTLLCPGDALLIPYDGDGQDGPNLTLGMKSAPKQRCWGTKCQSSPSENLMLAGFINININILEVLGRQKCSQEKVAGG